MTDAAAFLADLYALRGGLAEHRDGRLELLAPADAGLAEEALLWTRPDVATPAEVERLHVGHPVLERALEAARCGGRVSVRHLPGSPPRKTGLDQEVRRAWQFRNARLQFEDARTAVIPWARFYFRVSYVSDEKREDLACVDLDAHGGAEVDAARLDAAWLEPGPGHGADRAGVALAYDRSRSVLARRLEPRARAMARGGARHAEVETARLEEYFAGILSDLDRRARSAAPERRAALEEKRRQTLADRDARRHDVDEKYRMRVSAALSCLELVDLPRLLVPVTLHAPRAQRSVELSWNALTHGFDALPCAGCGGSGFAFYLCDELHLACPACQVSCTDCRRVTCRGCAEARVCACCPAVLCLGCAAACADCGRVTCPRHAGACHPAPAAARTVPPAPPRDAGARPASPPRRPSSESLRSFHPGDLLRLFYDLTRRYRDLAPLLQDADDMLAAGHYGRAAQSLRGLKWQILNEAKDVRTRIRDVANALSADSPATVLKRLDALRKKVAPDAPRPAPRRPDRRDVIGVAQVLQQVCGERATPAEIDDLIGLACQAGKCYPLRGNPQGWAAGLVYVMPPRAFAGLTQPQVASLFGVSAGTVSARSVDLRLAVRSREERRWDAARARARQRQEAGRS